GVRREMHPEQVPVDVCRDRLAGIVKGGRRSAWERGPVFRRGAVQPLPAVHREGNYPGGRRLVLDRGEQAGLGQSGREVGVAAGPVVSLDGVYRAAVVVEEVELAILVLTKGDDAHRRRSDLWHLAGAIAVEARSPQPARLPVAEDVGSAQL